MKHGGEQCGFTELTLTFGLKHLIVSAPHGQLVRWRAGRRGERWWGLGMIGVGSATPEAWIAEQANLARPHGPSA